MAVLHFGGKSGAAQTTQYNNNSWIQSPINGAAGRLAANGLRPVGYTQMAAYMSGRSATRSNSLTVMNQNGSAAVSTDAKTIASGSSAALRGPFDLSTMKLMTNGGNLMVRFNLSGSTWYGRNAVSGSYVQETPGGSDSGYALAGYLVYVQAPSAPKTLVGTPSAGQVALSWDAPDSNGDSAITGYRVEYRKTTDTEWTAVTEAGTSLTISGLDSVDYQFRVAAMNALTTAASTWSVYSNVVTASPYSYDTGLEHIVGFASDWDRIVIESLESSVDARRLVYLEADYSIEIGISDEKLTVNGTVTPITALTGFQITTTQTGLLFSGVGGNYQYETLFTKSTLSKLSIWPGFSGGDTVTVGEIRFEKDAAAVVTSVTDESSPEVLDIHDVWLIHPRTPSLSLPLPEKDWEFGGTVKSFGSPTSVPNTVSHRPIGSAEDIVISFGNRIEDIRSLVIEIDSQDFAGRLDALLRDGTPILVRIPPEWSVRFREGFYAVGNVQVSEIHNYAEQYIARAQLPMQRARSPKVTQEFTWNGATVMATYLTAQDLLEAYANGYDLLIDRRL
ncbi:MAG: fibronectin type III domain-containing protein [Microbacteriaceae bacterium]